MSKSVTPQTSEQQVLNEVFKLLDAGGAVIQLRTREVMRTATMLRKGFTTNEDAYSHTEWDVTNGQRVFNRKNFTDDMLKGDGMDFAKALGTPLVHLRNADSPVRKNPDKIHAFVFLDPHPYIANNPFSLHQIQQYAAVLPNTNACIIFVTPDVDIPGLPMGTALITDAPTPSHGELKHSVQRIVNATSRNFAVNIEITDAEFAQVAAMGAGMTLFEFETYASLAVVEAATAKDELTAHDLLEGIAKGKTEVVKQSDILELFHTEDMADVGGMHRLKDWISDRADTFSDEAREFGVEPPKGVAIVGVPGTGKSLIAKAIASTLEVPLIRLDFGRVFSKFIGDSESRMRSSLKMLESMGRVVLFVDEIDKGLGGIGGGGDSGTSSRVLGAFLTWMQENKTGIFVILTANKIDGLPPELFRKGRMDAIFSVGLPNGAEREEVLGVHLRKRGRSLDDYSDDEVRAFLTYSDGFTPAEIEAAVKDALIMAYNDPEADSLTMPHIIRALGDTVPMSKSHAAQINKILEWAADNATAVNYADGKPRGSIQQEERAEQSEEAKPQQRRTRIRK